MTGFPAAPAISEFLASAPLPVGRPAALLKEMTGLLEPPLLPLPAGGDTRGRFAALAEIARHDLVLARLAEGHADAVAILAEARGAGVGTVSAPPDAVLGVWAAGPLGDLVLAESGRGRLLRGRRRWCSGAGSLSHALVTAEGSDAEGPTLVLVDLARPGIRVDADSWPAVGMSRSDTFDVFFDDVPLEEDCVVAGGGWYLARPGFLHGAAGVAACWWGGATGVLGPLHARCRKEDDPHARAAFGSALGELWAMECCLGACAAEFDLDPFDTKGETRRLVDLTRLVVEHGATRLLRLVGAATGAAPLGHDAAHAMRVADLTVYLRQHHGPRDAELIARAVLEGNSR